MRGLPILPDIVVKVGLGRPEAYLRNNASNELPPWNDRGWRERMVNQAWHFRLHTYIAALFLPVILAFSIPNVMTSISNRARLY